MADKLPPLVSAGSTTPFRDVGGNHQVAALVGLQNSEVVEKGGYRLPDGVVIKPDPDMPMLMSVRYEPEAMVPPAFIPPHPLELGQLKLVSSVSPVIKQELTETIETIKDMFNQNSHKTQKQYLQQSHEALDLSVPSTSKQNTNNLTDKTTTNLPPAKKRKREHPDEKGSKSLKVSPKKAKVIENQRKSQKSDPYAFDETPQERNCPESLQSSKKDKNDKKSPKSASKDNVMRRGKVGRKLKKEGKKLEEKSDKNKDEVSEKDKQIQLTKAKSPNKSKSPKIKGSQVTNTIDCYFKKVPKSNEAISVKKPKEFKEIKKKPKRQLENVVRSLKEKAAGSESIDMEGQKEPKNTSVYDTSKNSAVIVTENKSTKGSANVNNVSQKVEELKPLPYDAPQASTSAEHMPKVNDGSGKKVSTKSPPADDNVSSKSEIYHTVHSTETQPSSDVKVTGQAQSSLEEVLSFQGLTANMQDKELEEDDMNLALHIASRIQDQFTEAEFEELFNIGDTSTITNPTGKTASENDGKVLTSTENGKQYYLLDCRVVLNDCKGCKKQAQALQKVAPGEKRLHCCDVCRTAFTEHQAMQIHKWNHKKEQFCCTTCNTYYASEKNLEWHNKVAHKTTGNYECSFCGKRFLHREYKKNHERLHIGKSKYKCRICSKVFFGKTGYRGHMRRHLGFEPYKCKKCGRGFALIQELNSHVIRHTGVKQFKCRFCSRSFYRMCELKRHELSHSGQKPYACRVCGKAYACKTSCDVHEMYHTGDLRFTCPVCNKRFPTQHKLRSHVVFHSDYKPFKCQYCPKTFVNKPILICHERVHTKEKPYKCTYCPKAFAQPSDRTSHMRIHTGEKPYSCRYCDAKFRKIGARNSHEKTHTFERSNKCSRCSWVFPDHVQLKKHELRHKKGVVIPCVFCNRYYNNLVEHDKTHHEEKSPYRCTMCNERFITFQDRHKHEKSHAEPRRFRCSVCHEDFCRRNVRDKHEQKMHFANREKKYKCPVCSKMYMDDKYLAIHLEKIHSEERELYSCKFCKKTFKSAEYVKQHELIHQGLERKFPCEMCDYVTNRKYLLRRHLQRHADGSIVIKKSAKKRIQQVDEHGHIKESEKKKASVSEIKVNIINTPTLPSASTPIRATPIRATLKKAMPHMPLSSTAKPNLSADVKATPKTPTSKKTASKNISPDDDMLDSKFNLDSTEESMDFTELEANNSQDFNASYDVSMEESFDAKESKWDSTLQKLTDMDLGMPDPVKVKDMYQCPEADCGMQFTSVQAFKVHWRHHKDIYVCATCDEVFKGKACYKAHVKKVHCRVPCHFCHEMYRDAADLKQHKGTHAAEKDPYKCQFCNAGHVSEQERTTHEATHEGSHPYLCTICHKGFINRSQWRYHQRTHTGSKPYVCLSCGHRFAMASSLSEHVRRMHSNGRFLKCRICQAVFDSRDEFNTHRKSHIGERRYKCDLCPQAFVRPDHLRSHKERHLGIKPYKCDHCAQGFSSRNGLNKHVHNFHTGEGKEYTCKKCKKSFATRHQYVLHCKTHKQKELKFECQFCGQQFHRQESLMKHEQSHENKMINTIFSCNECGRKFSSLASLNYHQLFHVKTEDGKPTAQVIVNNTPIKTEATSAKKSLKTSGKKLKKKRVCSNDIKCQICDVTFRKVANLQRHFNKSHPNIMRSDLGGAEDNVFICAICDQVFLKKVGLVAHMRTHRLSLPTDSITENSQDGSIDMQNMPSGSSENSQNTSDSSTGKKHQNSNEDTNNNNEINKDADAPLNLAVPKTQEHKHSMAANPINAPVAGPATDRNDKIPKTPLTIKQVQKKDKKTHICNLCGQMFRRPFELVQHIPLHNGIAATETHQCHLCPEVFWKVESLKSHLKTHRKMLERAKAELNAAENQSVSMEDNSMAAENDSVDAKKL